MNNTYVSFYLSSNSFRLYSKAITILGRPPYIQFRVHSDGKTMIMLPTNKRSFTTFRIPKTIKKDTYNMRIYSKALCRILAKKLGWDTSMSYRIPGKLIEKQGLVIFYLSQAELIPKDSILDNCE